jgi:hypothetical protein
MSALVTKFSLKKTLILGLLSMVFIFALTVFSAIWGEEAALTVDRIIELMTSKSYSSANDLSRYTAIPIISETILTNFSEKLFGLGLGNCDTSAFAICNTPFYQAHSYLNYNWISSAFLFIETGWIGLITSIAFFIVVFIKALLVKRNGGEEFYCQISMVMSFVCIAFLFYNSSLRMDVGYVAFFFLALPFISNSSESTAQLIYS